MRRIMHRGTALVDALQIARACGIRMPRSCVSGAETASVANPKTAVDWCRAGNGRIQASKLSERPRPPAAGVRVWGGNDADDDSGGRPGGEAQRSGRPRLAGDR